MTFTMMPSAAHSFAAVRDEPADRLLRRVVRAEADAADATHRRPEVHDATPAGGLHVRVHRLHRPQRPEHAGSVEHVDVGRIHLGDGSVRPEGLRVVDDRVDAAERLDGLRDHGVDLGAVLDVDLDTERLRRRSR